MYIDDVDIHDNNNNNNENENDNNNGDTFDNDDNYYNNDNVNNQMQFYQSLWHNRYLSSAARSNRNLKQVETLKSHQKLRKENIAFRSF